ncbi:hypothetical protein AVI51_12205 [Piscirickettsia salmonis]|uniref:Uncharacterized protein n=1 Tax=Piscirickettsia salmonis TaxID=1238 RepID=A0A9Q5VKY5_PISSA|nr:hypothetical protein [Piscirickettsia salmonis]ALA26224.1 hypothetical protein KW89_2762 [Piscirickettsia salmonis]APS43662.1 hypothetical protein AVI48_04270 [Piscirickettsia salmonis]APS47017.1 hypothetical protein AVI49_04880 [Piscirickettsia salmonis]APS51535.1 hypothetical protein AVI50_12320 [Piscirickettsia salmonis]APS54748.1 hypothetical protein AVI51_12205 [Piscirickettsia salmonis]
MSFEQARRALQSAGIDFTDDLALLRGNDKLQQAIIALSNAGIDLSAPIIEREFGFPNAFTALRRNSILIEVVLALEKVGCLNKNSWLGIKLKDSLQREILQVIGQEPKPLPHGSITFTDIEALANAGIYNRPGHEDPLYTIDNNPELRQTCDILRRDYCLSRTAFWNFLVPGNQDFITAIHLLHDTQSLDSSTLRDIRNPKFRHLITTLHRMGALSLESLESIRSEGQKAKRRGKGNQFFHAISILGHLHVNSSCNFQEDDWPSIYGNDRITRQRRKVICLLHKTKSDDSAASLLTVKYWRQVKTKPMFQTAITILNFHDLLSDKTLSKIENEPLSKLVTELQNHSQFSPEIWKAIQSHPKIPELLRAMKATWDAGIRLSFTKIINLCSQPNPIDAVSQILLTDSLNKIATTAKSLKRDAQCTIAHHLMTRVESESGSRLLRSLHDTARIASRPIGLFQSRSRLKLGSDNMPEPFQAAEPSLEALRKLYDVSDPVWKDTITGTPQKGQASQFTTYNVMKDALKTEKSRSDAKTIDLSQQGAEMAGR